LIAVYGDHILRVVRRRLHGQLRRQFDSMDFQQAVWASFFDISRERLTFQSPEELNRYLAAMTVNKLTDAFRNHLQTQKHNLNREKSLEEMQPSFVPADPRQATPSQLALADEFWERLLTVCDGVRDPKFRTVFAMLRDGHTYEEISAETGFHVKLIQRLVRKVKERMPQ
jgi:RNA polymerase sigma factor (sigma-70 family)